jgi:hypothetical protein
MKRFALILLFASLVYAAGAVGTASAVPTFSSIGVYWSGSGGSASTVCTIQYRPAGSSEGYKFGMPLVFDSRAVGGRPSNEYRGSLVNLTPGTSYEILLTAGSATATITTSTWSENFPVSSTTTLSSSTNITTSGTSSGYRVYTGSINGGSNNLYIDAAYIIIRNMTLTAAGEDAIVLGPNAHDVVVEGCDISGWGYVGMGSNNQAAVRTKGFSYNALNITRIVIQRNKIHDSRDNSNSWDAGGHPLGPNGINFEHAGGNHVIRYNEIYTTVAGKKFMDGIGGADNFTFDGFPNANSDIYGNSVKNVYDDAIESEGANCNVRIWGNYTEDTFTGIACAANSVGPLYIFRNITGLSVRSPYGSSAGTIDAEDRGPFNKCGSQDATYRGGTTFLFHNTILQPVQSGYAYPRGMGGGPVDNGGGVTKVYSRNNIWQTYKADHPCIGEWQTPSGNGNSYDYDLYNNSLQLVSASEAGSHMINGTPTYAATVPLTGPAAAGYFLASGSKGIDAGQVLANFNDGYSGTAPDIGAYETGSAVMQYGVNAYTTPVTPVNQAPAVNAGPDVSITLPTSSVDLTGSATDPDGSIAGSNWSQVSGPNQATILSTGTSANVSGLVAGSYVFMLSAIDDKGATGSDMVTVTVANQPPPPNILPVANAGVDRSIYLPNNSVTMAGSGTDSDGSIQSYAWTRVTGPTTYSIANAGDPATTISSLVAGSYIFRLTVTDNAGGQATDDVLVTVLDTSTGGGTTPPPPPSVLAMKSTTAKSAKGAQTFTINVATGDLIIISTTCETNVRNASISNSRGMVFTKRADASAYNSGDAEIYTAVAGFTGSVSITVNWGSFWQGSVVYVIAGQEANLAGARIIKTNQSSSSASLASTKAGSLLIGVISDWRSNDGAGRQYRDAVNESAYQFLDLKTGTFYHFTAGAASVKTYTEGLKTPTSTSGFSTIIYEIRPK